MDSVKGCPDSMYSCVSSRNNGLCTCRIGGVSTSEAEATTLSSSRDMRQRMRYKDNACSKVRLQTFSGWTKCQTPDEMAAAGFFFTRNGDIVRCFVCGIGLQHWDPEDDPFVEHARWSPQCWYIIKVKGEAFVQLVQHAVEEQEAGEITQQTSTNFTETYGNLQSLEVDSPFTGADACSDITKSEYYSEPILRQHPLLTAAAQSVLEMGYLPKYIKTAVDRVLETKGWERLSGENILEEIFAMEENGEIVNVPTSQNSSSISSSNETITEDERKRMEEENQLIKESRLCKICCENPVVIVFLPCSHLVCCGQCSPAMKKCPMCRQPIKGRVRVSW